MDIPVNWEDMLDDLLEVESGLSKWELDFIESLDDRRGDDLTDRQQDKLEELWLDHC